MICLSRRAFTNAGQHRFASASGDHNPMHVDAVLARRTQPGAQVVHGVHLLLWALDSLAAAQPDVPPMRGLCARFNRFVYLNEPAEAAITEQRPDGVRLSIIINSAPSTKIDIDFGEPEDDSPSWLAAPFATLPCSATPAELTFEQMSGLSGSLPFQVTAECAAELFSAAARWLGPRRIAALAATSHIVGMVCPGLHSIYGGISITARAASTSLNSLTFRVAETDPRFHAVDIEIAGGGLTKSVMAFARTPPVQQPPMHSLAGLVASAEFAGGVALIVGGSLGLGELTAKLIATGGGRVTITWQSGEEDAERVAQAIRSAGGACETLHYDACNPALEQLASLAEAPTHVYYFATPHIYRPQAEIFSMKRLNEFLAVYVDGFWQLSQALRARSPKLSLLYPSSIAVAERFPGMTEYAMAKAAGEVLCADINASLPGVHVTVSRLPRLPTDQTAAVVAVETASAVETMLPIVRAVQSWPR